MTLREIGNAILNFDLASPFRLVNKHKKNIITSITVVVFVCIALLGISKSIEDMEHRESQLKWDENQVIYVEIRNDCAELKDKYEEFHQCLDDGWFNRGFGMDYTNKHIHSNPHYEW